MTNEEWNEIQSKIFLQLFKSTDGVSSKQIISALDRRRNVFKKFNSIVGKEIDPNNDRFKVMDIEKVNQEGIVYLILRVGLWEFVAIDVNNMRCLSLEEATTLLNNDLFDKFRGLDENDAQYFSFEKLSKKAIKKLVDYYCEEEQVLSDNKYISFKFYHHDGIMGTFTISFDKSDTMVSVNDFKGGRCNYIFLDNNLKVYGASNLTGNKEEVARLFDGSRDIFIPEELLGSIYDEVMSPLVPDSKLSKKSNYVVVL